MCYTTIKVHAEQLAAKLAQRKVEKKWETPIYIQLAFIKIESDDNNQ